MATNHNTGIKVITLDNKSIKESNDKFLKETPLDIIIEETHNPLDIPFGHEVHEVNMNPKDPEKTEEGGMGSGRNDEGGGNQGGAQAGPLISFGESIVKELMDAKLKECSCHKNK